MYVAYTKIIFQSEEKPQKYYSTHLWWVKHICGFYMHNSLFLSGTFYLIEQFKTSIIELRKILSTILDFRLKNKQINAFVDFKVVNYIFVKLLLVKQKQQIYLICNIHSWLKTTLCGIDVLVLAPMELAQWQVVIMVYRDSLKKAPYAIWMNCIIHREAFASKTISSSLNEVLLYVIEIVHFIKIRPKKFRCFQKMCEDMGAEHTSLL